jgi:hypothetical protein
MTPSPRPSPRWGEGKGEGFRILNLVIGAFWGFGLPARSRFGEGRCLEFGDYCVESIRESNVSNGAP